MKLAGNNLMQPQLDLTVVAACSVCASKPSVVDVQVRFDGGCSPNPGAKYGSFEVRVDGSVVVERSRVQFGRGTNNEAEFDALELALAGLSAWLGEHSVQPSSCRVSVFTDSKIVEHRLAVKNKVHRKAKWRERSEAMFRRAEACLETLRKFRSFSVDWEPRSANVETFGH